MATKKRHRSIDKDGNFNRSVIRKYMKDPNNCPYCGKREAKSAGKQLEDGMVISVLIECDSCDKRWWEIYDMTSIEPMYEGT